MGRIANAPVNYPVFGLSGERLPTADGGAALVNVGGGGSARSGIKNCVSVVSLAHDGAGIPVIKQEAVLETGERLATSVDVSLDGTRIATSVSGGTLLIEYNAKERALRELCTWQTDFSSDSEPCQGVVRFSPVDSSILATGGDHGFVTIWRVGKREGAPPSPSPDSGAEPATPKAPEDSEPTVSGEPNSDQGSISPAGEEKGVEVRRPLDDGMPQNDSSSPGSPTAVEEEAEDATECPAEDSPVPEAEEAAENSPSPARVKAEPAAASGPKWAAVPVLELAKVEGKGIRDLVFSPSGSLLVSASEDKTCRVWDCNSGNLIQLLPSDTAAGMEFKCCRFVSESRLVTLQVRRGRDSVAFVVEFVRNGEDGKFVLGRSVQVLKGSSATALHVHAPFLSVGDARGGVTLLDLKSLSKLAYHSTLHSLPITGLSTLPSDRAGGDDYIVSSSVDKTLAMVPARRPLFAGFGRFIVPAFLVLLVLIFRFALFSTAQVEEDGGIRNEL